MSPNDERGDRGIHCDDPAADLLIPFLQGRIGAGDAQAVEAHLVGCAACAERLDLLRWMQGEVRENGARAFEAHVPSEEMAAFCDAPVSLPSARRGAIERHLEMCATCADEMDTLRDVSRDLATEESANGPAAAPAHAAASGASFAARLLLALRSPAVVALLLLAVPAFLGVRQLIGGALAPGLGNGIETVGAPHLLLSDTERGGGDAARVPLPSRGDLALLVSSALTPDAGTRFDADLEDARGRLIWHGENVASLDQSGTFLVLIGRSALRPGEYVLTLTGTDARSGTVKRAARYPFALVRGG